MAFLVLSATILVFGETLLGPGFGLPVYSTVALVAGGLVAAGAWYRGQRSQPNRIGPWDLSGALLLLGFAAAILGEPERVLLSVL
jgi:hypothetical protein